MKNYWLNKNKSTFSKFVKSLRSNMISCRTIITDVLVNRCQKLNELELLKTNTIPTLQIFVCPKTGVKHNLKEIM